MLMNDKIMFDRYYCINSAKNCKNEENIGTLYFITSLWRHGNGGRSMKNLWHLKEKSSLLSLRLERGHWV